MGSSLVSSRIQLLVRLSGIIRYVVACHFSSPVPVKAVGKTRRRACKVGIRTSTRDGKHVNTCYQCDVCKTELCMIDSFENYRTAKHF